MSSEPRGYDLADPEECRRLLIELRGYMQVSHHNRDGTDWTGRQFALNALRNAIKAGYRLVPGVESDNDR